VDPWQVSVENQNVVANDARLDERVGAVRREVDRHPLAAQPARDRIG
jgi:hypothetical protein